MKIVLLLMITLPLCMEGMQPDKKQRASLCPCRIIMQAGKRIVASVFCCARSTEREKLLASKVKELKEENGELMKKVTLFHLAIITQLKANEALHKRLTDQSQPTDLRLPSLQETKRQVKNAQPSLQKTDLSK